MGTFDSSNITGEYMTSENEDEKSSVTQGFITGLTIPFSVNLEISDYA